MMERSHTRMWLSCMASTLTRYEEGFDNRALPPNISPGKSHLRINLWPSSVIKKCRARPLFSRYRCSAGLPWLRITEFAVNCRGLAAAKMVLRSADPIPSSSVAVKSAAPAKTPGDAIKIPSYYPFLELVHYIKYRHVQLIEAVTIVTSTRFPQAELRRAF